MVPHWCGCFWIFFAHVVAGSVGVVGNVGSAVAAATVATVGIVAIVAIVATVATVAISFLVFVAVANCVSLMNWRQTRVWRKRPTKRPLRRRGTLGEGFAVVVFFWNWNPILGKGGTWPLLPVAVVAAATSSLDLGKVVGTRKRCRNWWVLREPRRIHSRFDLRRPMKTGRCIDPVSRSWCGVSKDRAAGFAVVAFKLNSRGGEVSKSVFRKIAKIHE